MAYKRKAMSTLTEGPDWVPRFVGDGRKRRNPFGSVGLWVWLLVTYYLSIPAVTILPVGALLLIYSSLSPASPIRAVIILMFVVGLGDVLAAFLFRPKFKLERRLPARVRAGSEFAVEYVLENRRRLPAYDLELDPEFGARYFECLLPAKIEHSPARDRQLVHSRLRATLRGKYLMGPPRIVSRFPLNLCRFHCEKNEPPAVIMVYPAYTPLLELDLPTGKRFQASGLNRISKVSEAADFCGCRDWRAGDNPRHIHWRSSARVGKVIVKEFQEEYLSRAALIIDTYAKISSNYRSDALEAALSLAAGVADFLMRDEFVIDLFVAGPSVHYFQAGRSIAGFEAMLDVLAAVEQDKEPSITRLSDRVMDEIAGIGSALVLLLEVDRERLLMLEKLRGSGTAVKVLLISDKLPESLPADIMQVKPDLINRGLLTRL